MAKTSSILEAAMTKVDMPLPSPQPCFFNWSRVGTTTAGEIAHNKNLLEQSKLNASQIRHRFVLQNYTIPMTPSRLAHPPIYKGLRKASISAFGLEQFFIGRQQRFCRWSLGLNGPLVVMYFLCEPCNKSLVPTPVFVCSLKLMFNGVYLTHRYSQQCGSY